MKQGLWSMVGSVGLALVVLGQGSVRADDIDRAQGTWKVSYAAVGKTVATAGDLKGIKVIVEGNKFTLVEGSRKEVVHFSVIGGNPRGIEFRQTPKKDEKLHWHGIYEFQRQGHRLRLCWGPAEAARPKSFEHKDQAKEHRLFVLEK